MEKWILLSLFAILLLGLPACGTTPTLEQNPTPENPFLEEELAAQAIATASAKKTQAASEISPYAKIANEEKTYLAFWFTWNAETVFLPIAESRLTEINLPFCQLNSDTDLVIGKLFSGPNLVQGECVTDEKASENVFPIIRIPGHFDEGIKTENLNVIDLQGEHAENLSDVVTFIIENDLLGSGDLTLSIYRTDGPNGALFSDENTVPTYTLPAEALQITFSDDQLGEFEHADDVVYALERKFTWKIPNGYKELNLSPGDENWFFLRIMEKQAGNHQEAEHLIGAYIQVRGVGIPILLDD